MATYVIGDIHGCYDELQALLGLIKFDPSKDVLWFTGDLVNGGPKPAEVLRFIKSLGDKHICVLGNHDLVLLALAAGKRIPHNDRAIGFDPVFVAEDHAELIDWLRMRPMVHHDSNFNLLLVHAGVLPSWNLEHIQSYAHEVESLLRSEAYLELYANMFGNDPDTWSENLHGYSRIRFIMNCFTRMRFCTANGKLDLVSKGSMHNAPPGYTPWFQVPRSDNLRIIFGHWAALQGITNTPHAIAMDTGCVWGNTLSALCLETGYIASVPKL